MSDPMPNNHDHQAEVRDIPEYTPTWATQHGAYTTSRTERGL